jgi:threonine synthase
MRYLSTRGQAPGRDFLGVLLAGLAEDGGLYMPGTWPHWAAADLRALRGLPYPDLAARLIAPFAEPAMTEATLLTLTRAAYAGFTHPAIVPLVQIDENLWVQELFHGPTLAFKDLAMQFLGRLFDHVLTETGGRITILGATSGDTGSAAIEACKNRDRIDIAILHPAGRTSEVQRRQMTTVTAQNVRNIAVQGNFDDCQDLVKAAFADIAFRETIHLSAVNSINWARIAAQIAYYVHAALALGAPDREVTFAVPTGNFGNILAAWAAGRMGLPIGHLIVASNRNDILTRFIADNDMSIRAVEPSLSPSMDIAVSSNFERLLFELLGRDAARTASIMTGFRHTGRMDVPPEAWQAARAHISAHRLTDEDTLAEIRRTYRQSGYLADPHTATAIAAARAHEATAPGRSTPIIVAATAHPAKFPDAIEQAVGFRPPLPPHLADLYDRPELFTEAENDLGAIQAQLRAFVSRNAA